MKIKILFVLRVVVSFPVFFKQIYHYVCIFETTTITIICRYLYFKADKSR